MIATSTDIIEQPQPAGVSIRFKRLSLQGFKSFPDRAVLEFDHPVCAIVGPNGCGKSNILDALRWVLGEQGPSQLRAQNMSDVIFNGSATRKPVGLAEVSLTVEWLSDHPPHDYRDIEVTRRLYRSGESEYLLNRQPCRLKDIVDLFMDAGLGKGAYSLIEQGKVDALLLARPDERRGLIEQSAGIVKYKHRKKEAQSKLNLTEQNLDRVRDILGEVRSRRAVLARQARKAERFRELVRERDETRNAYLTARFAQSLRDRTALTTRLASLEDDAARLMAETALKAAAVEQARLRVDSATDALRAEQKNAEQNDMQLDFLTRRLADLHARSNALTRSSQDIESEQNELQGRRTESETSAEEKAAALSNIERSLQALEQDVDRARIEESRHQDTLTQLRKELRSLKDRELKCLELAARRRNQQIEYEEGLRRLRSRAEKLYRERDRVALEREQSGVAVRSTIASIRDLEESERGRIEELARCEDRIMARRRAVDERRGQIQAMDARLMECSSRARSLTDIIRAGEGLGEAVRNILTEYSAEHAEHKGILGLMADTYETEPIYERAVAAALAGSIQGVVVEGHGHTLQAVSFLNARKIGRCVFTPLQSMRHDHPSVTPSVPNARHLRPLVRPSPGFDALLDLLLHKVYLVDDLPAAISVWESSESPIALVTLAGETISEEGIVTGGFDVSPAGEYRAKKQEIRSLQQEIRDVTERRDACEGERAAYMELLLEAEQEHKQTRESLSELRLKLAAVRRDSEHLERQLRQVDLRVEAIEAESGAVGDEIASLSDALDGLHRDTQSVAMAPDDIARMAELDGAIETHDALVAHSRHAFGELRIATETTRERLLACRREVESMRSGNLRLRELTERLDQRLAANSRQFEEVTNELRATTREIESCNDRQPILATRVQTASARLGRERDALQALDQEWNTVKESLRAIETERSGATIRIAELNSRMEMLREQSQIDLEAAASHGGPLPDSEELEAWKSHVESLEHDILALGDVNLAALDEHREIVERNQFLDEQVRDLDEAIAALKSTISQINTTSRNRFMEAFEQVNRNFGDIFAKLFEGGEAELRLENPDDPLETGVEIVCKPPGKRARTIDLLSGGEKALCALALLFAGFKYRPAPILYLDEVDAALDDANVLRFTRYLKELALDTQVVMITHNPLSMEIAEALYGITMVDPGISKIVSARIGML